MLKHRGKRWMYYVFDAAVVVVVMLALFYLYLITYGEGVLRNRPEAMQVAASTIITNAEGTEISRLLTQTKGYSEYAELHAMPDLLKKAFWLQKIDVSSTMMDWISSVSAGPLCKILYI